MTEAWVLLSTGETFTFTSDKKCKSPESMNQNAEKSCCWTHLAEFLETINNCPNEFKDKLEIEDCFTIGQQVLNKRKNNG